MNENFGNVRNEASQTIQVMGDEHDKLSQGQQNCHEKSIQQPSIKLSSTQAIGENLNAKSNREVIFNIFFKNFFIWTGKHLFN